MVPQVEGRGAGGIREGAGVRIESRVRDAEVRTERLAAISAHRAEHVKERARISRVARGIAAGVVPDNGDVALRVNCQARQGLAGDDLAAQLLAGREAQEVAAVVI